MRQIYSSQRLETVEGVAHLLEEAGIATHISNGRSYKGGMGGRFSYSDPIPAQNQPALWIKFPEDQPRARQILREAGLLDTTRPDQNTSYLPTPQSQEPKRNTAWGGRIRIMLLALIGVAAFLSANHMRQGFAERKAAEAAAQPTATPVQPPAPAAEEEGEVRIRITPSE